jgi:hypothetical protein
MFVASVVTTRSCIIGLWYLLLINVISKSHGIHCINTVDVFAKFVVCKLSLETQTARNPLGNFVSLIMKHRIQFRCTVVLIFLLNMRFIFRFI